MGKASEGQSDVDQLLDLRLFTMFFDRWFFDLLSACF